MMVEVFYAWTQVFLILCSACAVYIGIFRKLRHIEMRFIVYYSAASLLETIWSPIIDFEMPEMKAAGATKILGNLFLLLEFIIIYNYFFSVLKNSKTKRLLYIISVAYLAVMFFMWAFKNTFNKDPDVFFVPQAICILYPTFCHIIELIKNPSKFEIVNVPSFWITTGIMLYFGCTLPLFLLADIFDFSKAIEKSIFSINFICYGVLFIFIIKAYLCKETKVP